MLNYAVTQLSHVQGDFDVIGGASALTEAEVIKVLYWFFLFLYTRLLLRDSVQALGLYLVILFCIGGKMGGAGGMSNRLKQTLVKIS